MSHRQRSGPPPAAARPRPDDAPSQQGPSRLLFWFLVGFLVGLVHAAVAVHLAAVNAI
jgi:hypothetical protein